jgi:hypothetical protein
MTEAPPLFGSSSASSAATKASRSPANVAAAADERKAIELRIAGYDTGQIALAMGISSHRVAKLIDGYLEAHPPMGVEALRTTFLMRYEHLWAGLMPRLHGGDDDAIRSALSVLEAVRKLTGADQPQQIRAVVEHLMPEDIELRNKILAIEARNRAIVQGTVVPDEEQEQDDAAG